MLIECVWNITKGESVYREERDEGRRKLKMYFKWGNIYKIQILKCRTRNLLLHFSQAFKAIIVSNSYLANVMRMLAQHSQTWKLKHAYAYAHSFRCLHPLTQLVIHRGYIAHIYVHEKAIAFRCFSTYTQTVHQNHLKVLNHRGTAEPFAMNLLFVRLWKCQHFSLCPFK